MGVNQRSRRKTESPGAPGKGDCPGSGKNELGVELRGRCSKEVDKGTAMRGSWSKVAQRMQWFRKAALF